MGLEQVPTRFRRSTQETCVNHSVPPATLRRPFPAELLSALTNAFGERVSIAQALTASEVRRRMDEFGLSWDITSLADCDAEVRAERERWTEYTRVAGIQPE